MRFDEKEIGQIVKDWLLKRGIHAELGSFFTDMDQNGDDLGTFFECMTDLEKPSNAGGENVR